MKNKHLQKLYEQFCAEFIPAGGRPIADAKWADRAWKKYVEPAYRLGEKAQAKRIENRRKAKTDL
jgi:hypothetical protein